MIDRRAILKGGGIALFSVVAGPTFLERAARAATGPGARSRRKVLVTIFQRGAMDAVMAVPPLADSSLRKLRPRLAMSATRAFFPLASGVSRICFRGLTTRVARWTLIIASRRPLGAWIL